MVTLQQVEQGLINYIENEIGQKAVGVNKFATYFLLPQIPKKVEGLFSKYKSNEMFIDYLDENSNIDLDKLYNHSKSAIRKSGQIQLYGIIFSESDIDKLYNYIKNTAVNNY